MMTNGFLTKKTNVYSPVNPQSQNFPFREEGTKSAWKARSVFLNHDNFQHDFSEMKFGKAHNNLRIGVDSHQHNL